MYNIVTYISIDTEKGDNQVIYPSLTNIEPLERRVIYWKLAAAFFCTSLKCNQGIKHIIYTNDSEAVFYRELNLKEWLTGLGVEIRYLPFNVFRSTAGLSKVFKNAYYRFEVMRELGKERQPSILLDTDCLWTKDDAELEQQLFSDKLLVLNVHKRTDPYLKHPHDLSMADMGELYKKINPAYPVQFPVWYGGEVAGGTARIFQQAAAELEEFFKFLIEQARNGLNYTFANGKSVFDGSEFVSSYVYNNGSLPLAPIDSFIKRLWNQKDFSNISPQDINFTIWHLPGEKSWGLSLLFEDIIRVNSEFWELKAESLKEYLGEYVGIPARKAGFHFAVLKSRLDNFAWLNQSYFGLKDRPHQQVIDTSHKVIQCLKAVNVFPEVLNPLSEGGIEFKFICNQHNFMLSLYNDGRQVFLKDGTGIDFTIANLIRQLTV